MIGFRLAITIDGKRVETTITARALVEFERHFRVSYATAFARGDRHAEYELWLCWRSLNSAEPFDDWLARVGSDVEVVDDADPSTPATTALPDS